MSTGKFFLFEALIYLILLLVVFFGKKRLNNVENKIYSFLIIIALFELVTEIILDFIGPYYKTVPLISYGVAKIYLVFLLLWTTILSYYVIVVAFKMKHKDYLINKIKIVYYVLFALFASLILVTPIKFYYENLIAYTYGTSVNLVYFAALLLSFIATCAVIWNYKKFKDKRFFPLITFIIFGSICSVIQFFNPGLLLATAVHVFVTFLMYFTIENPDVQIMEELYKNKKLIEKSNEDTSNFLFRMTQDIKKPIKNMIDVSDNLKFSDNINELKDGMKFINNNSRDLDYLINDALDVSAMNTRRLKIYDSRYNPVNLFKEVEYRFRESIDKNIKFHFSISNNMPEYLYGDSIKLKQSISSILKKALDKTEKGSIELDVSDIIKYGICRLIITITDTGCGISIDEVNKILSLNSEDLAAIDLRDRDGEYLNLREVKKMISLLGGNLMVKSETGKGTVVTIVLEQKIVETRQTTISKKLEAYEQSLYHNKKIMVVDDDAKELAMITTWLENHDAVVNGSLFGRDCIEKIASNMKYDLILLDDDTSTYSALEVLKELKEKTNFKIPVVVMIDDGKEFIKLHYLQDGFADCILKSKLESELERILKRF